MAIGRKRKTHRQKKIDVRSIRRIKKIKQRREPKVPKRFLAFKENYENAVKSGQLDVVKRYEKQIEQISKYLNKDGTPSKKALRSKKALDEFNRLVKEFNKEHRKWGKQFFKEKGIEQEIIKTKGASTYTQKELKQLSQTNKTTGKSLTEIALNISEQYRKMVDLFALDSFEKLREQLNIGSPVVERLANSGLTLEDADKYFTDFLNAKNTIPKEARKLASEDELNSAINDLIKLAGKDNIKDALELYMLSNKQERDNVVEIAIFHAEHNSKKGLKDFYDEIQNSIDPDNRKSWREFL